MKIRFVKSQTAWTKARWKEATGYGENEAYLVLAIKQHLLTEDQKRALFDRNVSIEDVLNGRVENDPDGSFENSLFSSWNATLGWREFGY